MSVPPPAPKGTTMRTDFSGQASARTWDAKGAALKTNAIAAARRSEVCFMMNSD
jgi:hypothetical protein